jgi:orotidine-5'-phosphate decarboxylase
MALLTDLSDEKMRDRIIVALDVSTREDALQLVKETRESVGLFKVGSQLFMAEGPAIVREIVALGGKVFLDVKLHDIPNTVSRAAVEAARLGISMMTIHASGGRAMMESLVAALRDKFGNRKPLVMAVTVLTSLDTRALFELGLEQPLEEQVERLALLASECGIDGVVCSPREITVLRKVVRADFKIVTPGIRLADQSLDDQQRTATPAEAFAAGADYIVVGRAVTACPDPKGALERLMKMGT